MADQAENLRRLARAQLAWREIADKAAETESAPQREAKHNGSIVRIFSAARLKPAARDVR